MTRYRFPWSVGLVLLLSAAWPGLGRSATITVEPGQSINDGIRQLQSGDTLLVKNGTSTEPLDANSIPNGSQNTPTIVKAETPGGVIIRPEGNINGSLIAVGGDKQWIVIDGFVLDLANTGYSGGGLDLNATNGARDILIQNLEIRNKKADDFSDGSNNDYLTTAGIGATGAASNIVMRNVHVHDIGMNCGTGQCCNECYGYGIYLSGNGYTLENSEFYNISGWAVHGYTSAPDNASDNILRNNVFRDSGGPVLLCQRNNQIYNNILLRLGTLGKKEASGIQLAGSCAGQPSTDNKIYHNTIVGSNGACINLGYSSQGTVQNNICWHNGTDAVEGGEGGNTVDHNLLGTDPRFVNVDQGDFHLQAGSPAIDAGVQIEGRAFQGAAPDLGACEVGEQTCGGPGTTTPPSHVAVPPPTHLRLVPGAKAQR